MKHYFRVPGEEKANMSEESDVLVKHCVTLWLICFELLAPTWLRYHDVSSSCEFFILHKPHVMNHGSRSSVPGNKKIQPAG